MSELKNTCDISNDIEKKKQQLKDSLRKINDDILGSCLLCKQACDDYHNCLNALCNKHFIACYDCVNAFDKTCSQSCQMLIAENSACVRPEFNKYNASSNEHNAQ